MTTHELLTAWLLLCGLEPTCACEADEGAVIVWQDLMHELLEAAVIYE